jgi:hypothetical protein
MTAELEFHEDDIRDRINSGILEEEQVPISLDSCKEYMVVEGLEYIKDVAELIDRKGTKPESFFNTKIITEVASK